MSNERRSPDFSSAEGLRRVVDDVHIVPLAMSLVHLTGDSAILDAIQPYVKGPWDYSETIPPQLKETLRARMQEALQLHRAGRAPLQEISPRLMQQMLDVAAGETVSPEYGPMIRAQMGLDTPPAAASPSVSAPHAVPGCDFHVVIVGAGVSGICAAIKLKQRDISFEIIEKNADVGGTWFENRYPGCAVDTPNHFYQFSFEPNDDWPNYYSRRQSNLEYFQHCADKYGIRPHIKFQSEVISAQYDEPTRHWSVVYRSASGATRTVSANALMCAVGQLNRPMVPDFPGLDQFEGPVVHTANWSADVDIAGRNVALIGSGASAVQVGCAIAPEAKALSIFQRSGSWIVRSPNIHRRVSGEMKWALKYIPFFAAWNRFQLFWGFADGLFPALKIDKEWNKGGKSINFKNERIRQAMVRYIGKELEGREDLLEKAVPDYPPYGKRVLADPGWFKMLRRPNVRLLTSGIEAIEAKGLRTRDGAFIPANIIVMATGFHAGRMLWPMEIKGLGGKTVREVWGDNDPRAYLGITAPDFPNMFVLYGPNTGLGHGGSFTFLAECQVRYAVGCIEQMIAGGLRSMRIKREVFQNYNQAIDEALKDFVWSHPSVQSWYKNANGRIIINSPWRLVDYWRFTLGPELHEYELET